MRILIVIPHYYRGEDARADNRSRHPAARRERAQALAATILSLQQTFGERHYGLDHQHGIAWQVASPDRIAMDIIVCTTGGNHVLADLPWLTDQIEHRSVETTDPKLLGFACHKLLTEKQGVYDYYCYVEDDIAISDPLFFRKRALFDDAFGPEALLQANRYELRATGPVQKLYVDYRISADGTSRFQDVKDRPELALPFFGETVRFERPTYPSAGCFFLNTRQLGLWRDSPGFLDGDVSYMSPLDSAVTLSVMKAFRIYKSVLDQASFLEVRHISPRWILGAEGLRLMERAIPFSPHEAEQT